MKIKNHFVFGEYNRYGFTIFLMKNGEVEELHREGNHRLDSYQGASLDSNMCLPLTRLRSFAIKTGKEIAGEHGAKWNGVERVEEEDAV